MRRARTWGWARTRRYDEPSNDLGPSPSHQSCPDCIIATRGYDFREGQVLQQCCEAVNRLEAIAARVRTDGEVIPDGKGGHRSHPSLRDEILNRGFVCKTLRNLGVLNGPRKFG